MNSLGSILLLVHLGNLQSSFWTLCGLMENVLTDYHLHIDLLLRDGVLFDQLLNDLLPNLLPVWESKQIEWSCLLRPSTIIRWFYTLFSHSSAAPPTECLMWIWDVVLVEGPSVMFHVALTILRLSQMALMEADEEDEALSIIQSTALSLYNWQQFAEEVAITERMVGVDVRVLRQVEIFQLYPTELQIKLRRSGFHLPSQPFRDLPPLGEIFDKYAVSTSNSSSPTLDFKFFEQVALILQFTYRPASDPFIFSSVTLPLLFQLMDTDCDQQITLLEFVVGMVLLVFRSASLDEQILFLYDQLIAVYEDMTPKLLDNVIQTAASIVFSCSQYKSCKRRKRDVSSLSSSSYFPSLSHSFILSFNPSSRGENESKKQTSFAKTEGQVLGAKFSQFAGWSVERELQEEWVVMQPLSSAPNFPASSPLPPPRKEIPIPSSSSSSLSSSPSSYPPYSSKIMIVANFCAQKQFLVEDIVHGYNDNANKNTVQIRGTYPIRFDGELEVSYDPKKTDENGFVVATSCKLEGAYFDASRFCIGVYSVATNWKLPYSGKTQFYICGEEECQEKMANSCTKILPCSHICRGVRGEECCLPCVEPECSEFGVLVGASSSSSSSPLPMQTTGDDFCSLCWTEEIRSAPSVLMNCGHVYHKQCVIQRLKEDGHPGALSCAAAECGLCGKWYECGDKNIKDRMDYYKNIKESIHRMTKVEMDNEKIENEERVTDPNSEFYKKPFEFALFLFVFYKCEQCPNLVYGGHRDCGPGEAAAAPPARGEGGNGGGLARLCKRCKDISGVYGCRLHGATATIFKCRFCCKVATYFCGSMCHYCDPCHDKAGELTDFNGWKTKDASKLPKCDGPETCPLGVSHPANGIEHPLGCSICRERSATIQTQIMPNAMLFSRYSPMILFSEKAKAVEYKKKNESDEYLLGICEEGKLALSKDASLWDSNNSSFSFSSSSPDSLISFLPSLSPKHDCFGVSFTLTDYQTKKFVGLVMEIPGVLELTTRQDLFACRIHNGSSYTWYHYFDQDKNGRKKLAEEGGVVKVLLTWTKNEINMCSSRGFVGGQQSLVNIPQMKPGTKVYFGNSPSKSNPLTAKMSELCFWAEEEEKGGVDVVDMEYFYSYLNGFMEKEVAVRVSGKGKEKE
mmetsp:Transcript_37914/g.59954  ORF Transcript_37914/g.59954 Transcript_37914/m.59954 type:complete len:1138 (-) Transcript_37914:205-3618(-)